MDTNESTNQEEEFIVTKPKVEPNNRQPESAADDSEQDALFDVSQTSPTSACDDNPEEALPADKNDSAAADKKQIEELNTLITSLNDKYLRLMAEFDNYKRRSAKEYERLIESANERLLKDIIEVRENFDRAFKSNDQGEKFLEGMKLNSAKLNSILEKHGLEVYAEPGHEFNPELHDALMRAPHDSIPDSHISDVHERGYKLKGKIIKHAKVVVSSGKPEENTETKPDKI